MTELTSRSDAEPVRDARTAALSRDARLLIASRGVRSVGQGILVVDFAIYLDKLGWTAAAIGAVLSTGLIIGVVFTLVAGPASDRLGRKWFIVAYEVFYAAAALVALLTSQPAWLAAAAVVGGFGRGANGAAGPFGPVEQAWLAQTVPAWNRGRVYSVNAACGYFGMGLGAVIAGVPPALRRWMAEPDTYRILFAVVLAGAILCLLLVLRCDDRDTVEADEPPAADPAARAMDENRLLGKLAGVNLLNGLAIGLVGPFMAYWFHLRFGRSAEFIGGMMALGFLVSGLGSLSAGRWTLRMGVVRPVVMMRCAGMVLLFLLPFAPSFWVAAALYILRAAFNRATQGARQALTISLVRSKRRGIAASVGNVSIQVPRALMPIIGGILLGEGFLVLPFVLATALQAVHLVLYQRLFLPHDPGRRSRN